ncbi:hypothetical protein KY084_06000 [Stakelama sp. CBK3Z-3]|uniref:Ferritin-like domain-containing protein n=1 Tax=Stakelama flava TaxID=2860338 RepID=A0ABS6XJP7_9SPHN|nr:hypothetical protein [Stakelama flava]
MVGLLHNAIADELRHARLMIEELAALLITDEHFVERYVDKLQTFDLLAQYAEENAAILERLANGLPSDEAIAPVRLTAVHDRLHAALGRG